MRKSTTDIEPRPTGHRPQLDGLRALAVGGVLVAHTIPWTPWRYDLGAAGVRLFFVLSGFLISGILLRARAEADATGAGRGLILLAFYARRFLRIFPLYYGVLIVAAVLDLPDVRQTLGWHVSYLSNYFLFAYHSNETPDYLSHLWSLSVEEQFYLAWPVIALFAPLRRLPVMVVAAIVLAPCSRMVFGSLCHNCYPSHGGSVLTLSCLDALGLGALLAFVWKAGPEAEALRRRVRRLSLGLGGFLLAASVALAFFNKDWRYGIACKHLAYALIFLWLVDRAARGFGGFGRWLLEARPMVYLGGISYGIYVYHQFVPALVGVAETALATPLHFPADKGIARLLAVTAVTLPLAALSWHLFEKPINDFKSRFPYLGKKGRSSQTAAVGFEAAA